MIKINLLICSFHCKCKSCRRQNSIENMIPAIKSIENMIPAIKSIERQRIDELIESQKWAMKKFIRKEPQVSRPDNQTLDLK